MEEPKLTQDWDEDPLLEYVRLLADECFPYADADYLGQSLYPERFVKRYAAGEVKHQFTYANYKEDTARDNIADMLHALGLDADKFWFLLLFTCDLTSNVIIEKRETPKDELNRLSETILSNLDRKGFNLFCKRDMELNLKVSGDKHAVKVKSPVALLYLAAALCNPDFSRYKDTTIGAILATYNASVLGEKPNEPEERTPKLMYFTALMRRFLYDIYKAQGIKGPELSAYTRPSKDKMLLISKLARLTLLTEDDRFNDSAETLKSLWKTQTYHNMSVQQRFFFYSL